MKLRVAKFISFILITMNFCVHSIAAPAGDQEGFNLPVGQKEFKIMSYNLLNLFDELHDPDKLDHTFLPLNYPGKAINCQKLSSEYYRNECLTTNWTAEKVKLKIKQIKKVVELQGSLPDLLSVQEIENARVTQMLADELGYKKFVITNSPDKRGIDVALLFNEDKLEYIDHFEYDVSDVTNKPTRNILRVHFRPKSGDYNQIIAVYVNHWPSQAAAPVIREAVADKLRQIINRQVNKFGSENYYVIVTGDFNTTESEAPNGFHHVIASPYWKNQLLDVQVLSKKSNNPMTWKMPPGTYWYHGDGVYNIFDRFFISRNLYSPEGVTVDPKSFRILGNEFNSVLHNYQNRKTQFFAQSQWVPKKFDFHLTSNENQGFSDHYPIVVKFKMR
ncbi:MAG: hypothetical protein KDD50_10710 [Bdellovibrionales bacterium]|nr:hypothetical protein [Bdellovibrionales bacterium]